jgi:hypothetical protein
MIFSLLRKKYLEEEERINLRESQTSIFPELGNKHQFIDG